MTTKEQIEFIRQECIKVNPEIEGFEYGLIRCEIHIKDWLGEGWETCTECKADSRDIRLADVLLAIKTKYGKYWITTEIIETLRTTISEKFFKNWDLTKDLDGQSPETIEFIFNLLK